MSLVHVAAEKNTANVTVVTFAAITESNGVVKTSD